MRAWIFVKRCFKEIIRDPLTLVFGVGFPVILLVLLSVMNRNIPAQAAMEIFHIKNLLPGVIVFGFSFLALFGGLLLANDRESAFLTRLFTSPLRAHDFLLGYALPLLPLGIAQALLCILIGFCFGLTPTLQLLPMLLVLIAPLCLFVSIGLLFGALMNAKQAGSLCGALLTNVSAWLSGTWFSLDLLGATFKKVAYVLPFANAVDAARAALAGHLGDALFPTLIVCAWTLLFALLAVLVFRRKMRG